MCHHHRHQLFVEHKVQHGCPLLLQQGLAKCWAGEVDAHQVLQCWLTKHWDLQQVPAASDARHNTSVQEADNSSQGGSAGCTCGDRKAAPCSGYHCEQQRLLPTIASTDCWLQSLLLLLLLLQGCVTKHVCGLPAHLTVLWAPSAASKWRQRTSCEPGVLPPPACCCCCCCKATHTGYSCAARSSSSQCCLPVASYVAVLLMPPNAVATFASGSCCCKLRGGLLLQLLCMC